MHKIYVYCLIILILPGVFAFCDDPDRGTEAYLVQSFCNSTNTAPDGYPGEDICLSDKTLREKYCVNLDSCWYEDVDCEFGCYQGRCLQETGIKEQKPIEQTEGQCFVNDVDLPGSLDWYTKGECTSNNPESYNGGDECLDSRMLREFYCRDENTCWWQDYPCPEGCDVGKGRCRSENNGGLCINPNTFPCAYVNDKESCCPIKGTLGSGFGIIDRVDCLKNWFVPSKKEELPTIDSRIYPNVRHCDAGCCCKLQPDGSWEVGQEQGIACYGDKRWWAPLSEMQEACNIEYCDSIELVKIFFEEDTLPSAQTITIIDSPSDEKFTMAVTSLGIGALLGILGGALIGIATRSWGAGLIVFLVFLLGGPLVGLFT